MTETEQPQEPPEPNRRQAGDTEKPDRHRPPDHLNARPSWDCLICQSPWPCATAQRKLLREFRRFPSVLCIYMTAQMHDALGDLVSTGHLVPGDLFERFLGWTRRAGTKGSGSAIYDFDALKKNARTAAVA